MICSIIKYKKSLIVKKSIEKNASCKIDYFVCYFISISVIIFTIFKQLSIVLMQFLIFIKKAILVLEKLMIRHRIRHMQFFHKDEKFRYYNSFFFPFSRKDDFPFFFYILFFLSFALKILSLCVTSTNGFFFFLHLRDFVYELSSENITIFLLRLAHIGKTLY